MRKSKREREKGGGMRCKRISCGRKREIHRERERFRLLQKERNGERQREIDEEKDCGGNK